MPATRLSLVFSHPICALSSLVDQIVDSIALYSLWWCLLRNAQRNTYQKNEGDHIRSTLSFAWAKEVRTQFRAPTRTKRPCPQAASSYIHFYLPLQKKYKTILYVVVIIQPTPSGIW
ncbi:hypothetical protein BT96DRAFT_1009388 [Gymnopus androsaceus JB14]|uniref:Uncharacterized protein n=1 Tax=Gymnopus androsaceus JB14 TaxID=1447944 RepID=A0A6A4GCP4_9AGAR|nr:hypothetical protein BT96DRAFT_1009388 [Gymnopus androsaceus JB14]